MSPLKFTGSARFAVKLRQRSSGATGAGSNSARPRLRGAFLVLGLIVGGFGAWWAGAEYTILNTWPATDGLVVNAQIVPRRGSKQSTLYAPEITFQYEVEGRRYVSSDKSTAATSFKSWPEHVVNGNPAGSHRLLHYNPSDPSLIRFNQGYNFSTFGAPGIFFAIGLLFFALYLKTFRVPATAAATVCPACGAQLEFGRNTCPRCGTLVTTSPDATTG